VALDEVEWRTISSYNSGEQGSIERQNRDIEIILMKSIDGEYGTWEIKLDDIAYAMNTRISSRTNTMPFVLMLGRVPLGSQKYRMEKKIQGIVEEMPKEIEKREEWIDRLEMMNNLVYPVIGNEVERKQEILAGKMVEKRKMISFEVGELVMAKDVTRKIKWKSPYVGPFRLIRCNKGGAYIFGRSGKKSVTICK
jgi:hypothetical protein